MADKKIIVRIGADGTVDAETVGMYGAECLDYFAALEDLLAATTQSSSYTDDYHRTGAATAVRGGVEDTIQEGA